MRQDDISVGQQGCRRLQFVAVAARFYQNNDSDTADRNLFAVAARFRRNDDAAAADRNLFAVATRFRQNDDSLTFLFNSDYSTYILASCPKTTLALGN